MLYIIYPELVLQQGITLNGFQCYIHFFLPSGTFNWPLQSQELNNILSGHQTLCRSFRVDFNSFPRC